MNIAVEEKVVTFEIDGKKVSCKPGETIIQVADREGIYIPRFCYHPKLSVVANCRMCLVEVEKSAKTLPACATPVMQDMVVKTKSKTSLQAQKAVMEFLLINHPLDCPICDQGGECELQDLAMGYGYGESRYQEDKRVVKDEDLGPLVSTDMTRCIQCTRCVRFGEEIAGMPELGALGRGDRMQIGTYLETGLKSELSGNVIDVCPVGALTSKPFRFTDRSWEFKQYPSISPHDCLGSNLYAHVKGAGSKGKYKIMRVLPRENTQINDCWLSDRDRFSYLALNSDQRITSPMVKVGNSWKAVSWQDALDKVCEQLQQVKSKFGSDQIGAVLHPSSTTQEHYLWQKCLREFGTDNIDHRLQASDFSDQKLQAGMPVSSCKLSEIEKMDTLMLVGADVRNEQPLANSRIYKAHRAGAHIITVNAIDYDFNYPIQEKVTASVQSFVLDLAKIVKALLIASKHSIDAKWLELLTDIQPDKQAEKISKCLLIKASKRAIILGAFAQNHPQAAIIRALSNLIIEITGAELIEFTFGANAAGACFAGALPHRTLAGKAVKKPGLTCWELWQKPRQAYILHQVEPSLDTATPNAAVSALKQASCVVALHTFISDELKEYATVILPICAFTENQGSLINFNGVEQPITPVNTPYAEAKPAWKVVRVLANLLGLTGFDYNNIEEVTSEISAANKKYDSGKYTYIPKKLSAVSSKLMRVGEWPMYRIDGIVRRAAALQEAQSDRIEKVRMHENTLKNYNLKSATKVVVSQGKQNIICACIVDNRVPEGAIYLSAGFTGFSALDGVIAEVSIKAYQQDK